MADNIGNKAAKEYYLDIPAAQEGFYVKGASHCDYGMKNRLSRLFNPKSGNTVMLAFDHGYIMGPTAGLERDVYKRQLLTMQATSWQESRR